MYEKSIEYLSRGYSMIPLNKEKVPVLKTGEPTIYQRERFPTEEELETWFLTRKNNIGICTGKISGITVVDIDTSGPIIVPLETFPETYTVKTPTGGYHLYYLYNENAGQTSNTFSNLPHVDLRNDGGYVVAPPSCCDYIKAGKHITGSYTVHKYAEIVPFPIHLFLDKDKTTLSKQKISALLKNLDKMADGDGRNNALTRIAGKAINMVNIEDYESIAYPILLSANKLFKEPLKETEVRTIFDSITQRQLKKPLAGVEFLRNDKGIIPNKENIYRTLISDENLKGCFRYNTFVGMLESKFQKKEFETLQRIDIVRVSLYLMSKYTHFSRVNHGDVEDAVLRVSEDYRVSPPVEYFQSLTWDGTPRLDTWLSSAYNVEDNVYHQAVGSNWMKGLVKRLVHPGCKFDYVLVLEGRQGIKKSTSLAIIGGSWHVETVFTPDNKDFFMLFGGKAIVEFSEGETLSRTEAKHLKAIITMQFDKYRPPYERAPKDFPRQCVFAMTTNQSEYLKDETGNRRWLPVACNGPVNTEWLINNRDQLFAEAYHRVITLKETTWEFPEEETALQQSMRQIADPKEEVIYNWYFQKLGLYDRNKGVTTIDAFLDGIHKGSPFSKEMSKLEEMQISSIFKESLFLEKRRVTDTGGRFYKYFPTEKTQKLMPQEYTEISAEELFKTF